MFIAKVPPILSAALVRCHKSGRRVAIVGHDLSPGEGGQCGEVLNEPFLHLGLQGTVFGIIFGGIAVNNDAVS